MREEELAGLVDEHRVQLGAQHARGRQSQLLTQLVEHRLESASAPDGHRVPRDLPGVADRGVGQGPRSLPVSRRGPEAAQLADLRRGDRESDPAETGDLQAEQARCGLGGGAEGGSGELPVEQNDANRSRGASAMCGSFDGGTAAVSAACGQPYPGSVSGFD